MPSIFIHSGTILGADVPVHYAGHLVMTFYIYIRHTCLLLGPCCYERYSLRGRLCTACTWVPVWCGRSYSLYSSCAQHQLLCCHDYCVCAVFLTNLYPATGSHLFYLSVVHAMQGSLSFHDGAGN